MVAMAKKVKSFQIVFTEPCKSFYCGGDAVSGRVQVEVSEVTRVSAMKLLAMGCAKVEYAKGKQRCRQEAEYLRHQETLLLDGQPTGTAHFLTGIWFVLLLLLCYYYYYCDFCDSRLTEFRDHELDGVLSTTRSTVSVM